MYKETARFLSLRPINYGTDFQNMFSIASLCYRVTVIGLKCIRVLHFKMPKIIIHITLKYAKKKCLYTGKYVSAMAPTMHSGLKFENATTTLIFFCAVAAAVYHHLCIVLWGDMCVVS